MKFSTVNRSKSTYCQSVLNATFSSAFVGSSFIGKEKDEETGYGYYGARYLDHELMTMWLSVDPMSDKYPSISPYAYCAWNRPTGGHEHRLIKSNIVNNPVKLVDPDGRDWYQNTKTKQIYYNSGARGSNDAGKYGRMQGQNGWSWIGENNMFGYSLF